MIENNELIQSMLDNIIEKTVAIKNDFNYSGETHFSYVLEKLKEAQWDLDVLIKIANDKKEESE